MPYSYINMHTQALYWSLIELIKDVHLIHEGKVPNALWTIMCTYSMGYNYLILVRFSSKYTILSDISIATVYIGLFVLLLDYSCIIANSSHADQTFTGGFFLFTIVPFSSTESLTEYLIAPVFWVAIT